MKIPIEILVNTIKKWWIFQPAMLVYRRVNFQAKKKLCRCRCHDGWIRWGEKDGSGESQDFRASKSTTMKAKEVLTAASKKWCANGNAGWKGKENVGTTLEETKKKGTTRWQAMLWGKSQFRFFFFGPKFSGTQYINPTKIGPLMVSFCHFQVAPMQHSFKWLENRPFGWAISLGKFPAHVLGLNRRCIVKH